MSRFRKNTFRPSHVDEQIEGQMAAHAPADQAWQRVIERLQQMYSPQRDEHIPSLERVWQRVLAAEVSEKPENVLQSDREAPDAHMQEHVAAWQGGVLSSAHLQVRRKGWRARSRSLLAQLAAVLALVVLGAGFFLVGTLASHRQPLLQTGANGSGLYAYQANMIARLNTQTHQVIWQHTFSHEDVLANGSPAVPGPDQPFVSGGIIYVSTLANLGPGKRYLSALNAANGAVLWRQPSARAFANSTTLYTLVESQTLALSILTARDPRSGKQLWQRQYPIAGAKSDPAYGTDMTEGFRLVAVTDQLLYAVVVYRQQGQNLFARYGLSPVDGSIRWHTQEVIAGRMPLVEAHIASGIIYAAEYTLQSTTPHLDAHGMTIDEVPRVRVGAYDLATGHQLWQTPYMPGEEPNGGFDLTVSDDMLYLQTFNNQWPETARYPQTITTWHALDRRDGTVRWQYQKKDEGGMTGAALLGNSLYIEVSTITTHSTGQSLQVQIVALNAQPGTVRWATPVHLLNGSEKTPTPVSSIDPGMSGSYTIDMAPVADGSTVYYSVPGNRIYALQASDGRILTQFWVNKTAQTTVLDRLALFVA